MKLTAIKALACVLLLSSNSRLQSQTKKIIFNTIDSVYELTGGPGTCTYKSLPGFCPVVNQYIFSSTLYKQTFYFLTHEGGKLYSVDLSTPGSCTYITSFPSETPWNPFTSINALTVDKNGILYAVDNSKNYLYRLNPYTKELVNLGIVPASSGGDLVFYGDKLLLATAGSGLYEIDLDDPAASKQYMSTGAYSFWGLISFPLDCKKNKVYGLALLQAQGTALVELDLESKTIGGIACVIPLTVLDGASIVETGNTLGIWIDSIQIQAPCEATQLTGNATIMGYSATPGDLKYTLSNGIENTTGKFENLAKGNYQVHITHQNGCTKDTSFTIAQGLSPNALITSTDPELCQLPNGSIFMETISNYQPVDIRVNDSPPGTNNPLTGLGAGVYNISLSDQGGCHKDTTVVLKYARRPDFLGDITSNSTICEGKNGSIDVAINGNAAGVTASLNGGAFKPITELRNLQEGYYTLAILNAANCRYDTLLQIEKIFDPPPQITFDITDQFCHENNGKVVIHATGAGSPFNYNFDDRGFLPVNSFDKLAPRNYTIDIRNSNLCYWDSVVEIKPYIQPPVNFSVSKKDPTCRAINSGELRVNITGVETPYYFEVNNKVYNAGETVNIPPGNHLVTILNKNHCIVDSTRQELILKYEPECDRVSMPNAFSPNNDGNNDLFKPLHSPYVTQVSLTIHNRYGQVVFRSSPTQPGWNGQLNGHYAEQGNYAWVLTYRDFRGEPRKVNGLLMLVR